MGFGRHIKCSDGIPELDRCPDAEPGSIQADKRILGNGKRQSKIIRIIIQKALIKIKISAFFICGKLQFILQFF